MKLLSLSSTKEATVIQDSKTCKRSKPSLEKKIPKREKIISTLKP